MGYYIRLVTKSAEVPNFDELRVFCSQWSSRGLKVFLEQGDPDKWRSIYVETQDGKPVIVINREYCGGNGIFHDEILEFVDFLAEQEPVNAAKWVSDYICDAKQIIAIQFLKATFDDDNGNMPGDIFHYFQKKLGGIVQADGEGWSNELGWHVVWDFSDSVSGSWNCAVLENGNWVTFQMDLGDIGHRAAFKAGRVPDSASNISRS
jgi:hypothetical protein